MDTARNYIRFSIQSDTPDAIPGRIPFHNDHSYVLVILRNTESSNLSLAFANLSVPSEAFVKEFLINSQKDDPVYLVNLEMKDKVPVHISNYYSTLPSRIIDFDNNQSSVVLKLLKKLMRYSGSSENKALEHFYFKMLLQFVAEVGQQTNTYKSRQEEISISFLKMLQSYDYPNHSVTHYADLLYVTRPYLTRAVRSFTGTTPKIFINQRIGEVAKILLGTQQSIDAISDTLGFDSIPSFTAFFKKHEGISPLSYRKSNR